MNPVEISHLTKHYPDFSLNDVTFSVPAGYVTGFVGANGSGKTTTIKAALGMIHPNALIEDLPVGVQQRVEIIKALARDAKVLILDEPTGGLDPLARAEIVDMLAQFMVEEGHTILFSTHITSDLDRLADYLVILSRGRVVANGTAEEIIGSFRLVRGTPEHLTDAVRQASLGLRSTSLGWEAMMPADTAEALADRIVVEAPTIEDLAVHIAKEASRE